MRINYEMEKNMKDRLKLMKAEALVALSTYTTGRINQLMLTVKVHPQDNNVYLSDDIILLLYQRDEIYRELQSRILNDFLIN